MCNGKLSSFILTTPFLYVVFCRMSFYITSNIDVGGGRTWLQLYVCRNVKAMGHCFASIK